MTRFFALVLSFLVMGSSVTFAVEAEAVTPLLVAHAHNDYRHDRPLSDALDQGFCSVEADIFFVDGKILVGHDEDELTPERTLEDLYLKPLQKRVKENGGRVFRDGPVFWLWIDQKSDAEPTYRALSSLLEKYADMITSIEDGKLTERAVRVILSGNRPFELIKRQSEQGPVLVGIDGRLSDLDPNSPNYSLSSHLMPFLSDNWRKTFKWRGIEPMPEAEREKFDQIIRETHAAGRRFRFWATPETEAAWAVFLESKMDLINTDRLKDLRRFLGTQEK